MFNHYAKIKQILSEQDPGWYIILIHEPTTAKNFHGETVAFPHYYRIYNNHGEPIKYCKFQQVERLAGALHISVESLPIVDGQSSLAE